MTTSIRKLLAHGQARLADGARHRYNSVLINTRLASVISRAETGKTQKENIFLTIIWC